MGLEKYLITRYLSEPKSGFEPETPCLQGRRSDQLSYFGISMRECMRCTGSLKDLQQTTHVAYVA